MGTNTFGTIVPRLLALGGEWPIPALFPDLRTAEKVVVEMSTALPIKKNREWHDVTSILRTLAEVRHVSSVAVRRRSQISNAIQPTRTAVVCDDA